MNQNFEHCMEMLLKHEGGYVNHPSDPGGITNLGITKRTYDEFHGTNIDEEGMRDLTVEDVTPIYRRNYWERCRCQDLPSGVDWAVMDACVNHGTGRAADQPLLALAPLLTLNFLELLIHLRDLLIDQRFTSFDLVFITGVSRQLTCLRQLFTNGLDPLIILTELPGFDEGLTALLEVLSLGWVSGSPIQGKRNRNQHPQRQKTGQTADHPPQRRVATMGNLQP